jgi:hypothetical protein
MMLCTTARKKDNIADVIGLMRDVERRSRSGHELHNA